jgi:hypothetical protein
MILVFALIITFFLAIFVIYPRVRVANLAYKEASHIRVLARLMNTGHVVPGVLPSGFYPEEMTEHGHIRSAMDGAVLATVDRPRGKHPHWTLTYQKVPADVCVRLAAFLQDQNPGISTLAVGAWQMPLKAETMDATPVFSIPELFSACGKDTPDIPVTMVFSGP